MLWAAFWVSHRQEVSSVPVEYLLHRIGVENGRIQIVVLLAGLHEVHQASVGFGTKRTMHKPFLIPLRFERTCGDLSHQRRHMGISEGAKTGLGLSIRIRKLIRVCLVI